MKLFLRVIVLVLITASFFAPTAYAATSSEETVVILPKSDVVNTDYFAAGNTVRLSGTVNGDAYVAGGSVIVDGTINGDLLVAGGTVQISGAVKNDIRAVAGVITLGNTVGGNVTIGAGTAVINPEAKLNGSLLAGAGSLNVYGPIAKDVTAGTGTFILNAPVSGNMKLAVDEMSLQPKTRIGGDITYWSDEEAKIADNVAIGGALVYHKMPKSESQRPVSVPGKGLMGAVWGAIGLAALAGMSALFILGLILTTMFPVFSNNTVTQLKKNPWGAFGLGLITVITLPLAGLAAMMTVVGIPLGIFLLVMTVVLCVVSHIYAALFVGSSICVRFRMSHVHQAWQLAAGILVLILCTFVPVLGWLIKAMLVLMGTGALLFEKHAVYKQLRTKRLV